MPSHAAHLDGPSPTPLDKPADRARPPASDRRPRAAARPRRRPRRSLAGDTLLLGALFASLNAWLAAHDPGWLTLNPTPVLLLPLLLGGRYGPAAGGIAGACSAVAIVWWRVQLGAPAASTCVAHAPALAALPLTGLVAGELRAFIRRKFEALDDRCQRLELEHRRACANLEVVAGANLELQKKLAAHGVRLTSLDAEMRKLLGPATDDLFGASLGLLSRVAEISEAAIYSVDGLHLTRCALLGNGDELPGSLRADKVEIVDQALVEKQMVTCRELWGDVPQLFSRHLAAVPWRDPAGEVFAILLVRRLPFHRATWHQFAQIDSICTWIASYAHLKGDSGVTGTPQGERPFQRFVGLCVETHRRHALPSAGAYFVGRADAPLTQKQLADAITPLLRPTDVTASFGDGRPNLAVLMPMDSRRDAEKLAAQVAADLDAAVDARFTQTEPDDSPERFLDRLRGGHHTTEP